MTDCDSFVHLLVGHAVRCVLEVVAHRICEQDCILQHYRHIVAKVVGVYVLDVDAVYLYAAAVGTIETHQQVHDRGLAAAGRPDEGYLLARIDLKVEIVEHLLAGHV